MGCAPFWLHFLGLNAEARLWAGPAFLSLPSILRDGAKLKCHFAEVYICLVLLGLGGIWWVWGLDGFCIGEFAPIQSTQALIITKVVDARVGA